VVVFDAQFVLAVLLWAALAIYGFSALWWLLEWIGLSRGWRPGIERRGGSRTSRSGC
jgi:hypothetical protein